MHLSNMLQIFGLLQIYPCLKKPKKAILYILFAIWELFRLYFIYINRTKKVINNNLLSHLVTTISGHKIETRFDQCLFSPNYNYWFLYCDFLNLFFTLFSFQIKNNLWLIWHKHTHVINRIWTERRVPQKPVDLRSAERIFLRNRFPKTRASSPRELVYKLCRGPRGS